MYCWGQGQQQKVFQPLKNLEHINITLNVHYIETILTAAGSDWSDAIKTRWYITDIKEWPQIEEAAHEIFGRPIPCPTVVEVSALVKRGIRVEPDIWANVMHPNHQ